MPAGRFFSCQGCGRHAFPEPRLCYWCAHPLDEQTRAARVVDGILQAQVKQQEPLDKWEAERLRMRQKRRSLAKPVQPWQPKQQ
jgi:hypothetical protein